jgi:hypothetical protein
MIRYIDDGKIAYFNNRRYCRDDKTGYYQNSAHRERLHRAVWVYYNGSMPEGYHIHHKDHNKNNNDIANLGLVKAKKHMELHNIEKAMDEEWLEWSRNNLLQNARPKASEWHGSEEGRKWHKKHYEAFKHKFHVLQKYKCEYCEAEFETNKGKNRFCSGKCKSAWRISEGLDNEVRICECCKQEFSINKYSKQTVCSKSCSNRLYPRLPQLRKN